MSTSSISANAGFAFKLFAELLDREPDKNVFVSPTSVALALGMLLNGAAGETERQIAGVLGLTGMSLDEVNQANTALMRSLARFGPGAHLAIANSLWAKRGTAFEPEFLRRSRAFYAAEATELDFADPGAPEVINAWVSAHTEGTIERIVDEIPPDAVLYLINAIYFKGEWAQPFDPAATADHAFHLASGGQKQLPMMRQTGEFLYDETSAYQAIVLPYAGKRLAMLVLLPRKSLDVGLFRRVLGDGDRTGRSGGFQSRDGTIVLPRFKLEYAVKLNDPLKAIGMPAPFQQGADFSAMCGIPDVGIDEVMHKTFVEVNEEGTEAAAVTSVRVVVLGMMDDEEPFHMIVDRPFFCAIRDNQSDALLFVGAIVEP